MALLQNPYKLDRPLISEPSSAVSFVGIIYFGKNKQMNVSECNRQAMPEVSRRPKTSGLATRPILLYVNILQLC